MTPTTEALPAVQTAQQPTIRTRQCSAGWIACLASDPGEWQFGYSEAEAIGNLCLQHQEVCGVIQREE